MSIEIIGIIGGGFYLIAFAEASLGKWNGRSFWYESYNLLGSLFLGYYAVCKHAYMNIVLNVVWGVVALYAIRHIAMRHKHRKVLKRKKTRTNRQKSKS